jgi:hypothetical protein
LSAWRGAAFGLELRGDFPAPGFPAEHVRGTGGRVASIILGDPPPGLAGEELFTQPLPGGCFRVERGDAGYALTHSFYGAYGVSADGTEITCTPAELPDWLWQRFLVGQALPLAAALQGLEPLHASAAALDGKALLIMGTSGAGKSSVALHLVAGGAKFMADDVAALELGEGQVLAHSGPGVASIDPAELNRLPGVSWSRLGELDGEIRVEIEDVALEPVPVAALMVLVREGGEGEPELREPRVGLPALILGGTFNAYLDERDRLVRQLDMAAELAERVPVRELNVPSSADAAAVANLIRAEFS